MTTRRKLKPARREFFRVAAGAAAGAAASTMFAPGLAAQRGRGGGGQGRPPAPPPVPLGNGEPPAIVFQPYPGGTGAYLERLARERGRAAFERSPFAVEPWSGPVPTSEEDIAFLPVHRLSALIAARHITSSELTDIYLTRLERYDPTLLCAVTILADDARRAAREADADIAAGRYRGPLHGIPWGVKDLFAVKGYPTTWGSEDFQTQVIDVDAEVVTRLRDAGAVLIAKLATGRFAAGDNWFRGQTKNPWNIEQGSSGSSAGPASATAAGCVAFALGTETQGSIVSPTRRCGLNALRPTFGRISRYGGMVLSWSMDKVGPMCRTIEDVALVFNTIHGVDEKDPATVMAPFQWERQPDVSGYRIAYADDAPEEFLAALRGLGATLVPMADRPSSSGLSSLGVETAAAFDFYAQTLPPEPDEPPPAEAGAEGRGGGRGGRGGGGRGGRFTRGRTVTALDFLQSQRRRQLVIREMDEVMRDVDLYVTLGGDVGLTNQTGHPAAVFPYEFAGDPAQPRCITLIGSLFADDKILSVAQAYQASTDWHTRRPAL
jgi:Asp-tRNA(Asn)/Glu-tRNA(Gln) amidotransferase A subunit family amidase